MVMQLCIQNWSGSPVVTPETLDAASPLPPGSAVERVFQRLKLMAVSFEFRPGDRINEVALARELGVSRTPLREALNRLVADGFVNFSPNRGFTGRTLEVKEIFDLYEVRQQIETSAVPFITLRASAAGIESLSKYLDESAANVPGRTIDDLVALDEGFHERLIEFTGNPEMLRILRNVNARIRFVRWIDMERRREFTQAEHRKILNAVAARDVEKATSLLNGHINHRLDQVVRAVKEGYARIYVGPSLSVLERSQD